MNFANAISLLINFQKYFEGFAFERFMASTYSLRRGLIFLETNGPQQYSFVQVLLP